MAEELTEAQQRAKEVLESLGLTMQATFVPWSRSRSFKKDNRFDDLSLNWRVTIEREGRTIIESDYSQGIAHAPSYRQTWDGELTEDEQTAIRRECETGKVSVGKSSSHPILPPPLSDVLYCLSSDAEAIDYPTFEEWAGMFGYDPDSRSAEKTYRECLEIGLKLKAGIGEEGMRKLREAFQDY